MTHSIEQATTAEDWAAFGELIREYVEWSRVRYRELGSLVDSVFSHQSLDDELADLPRTYGPPAGVTLLARNADEVIGGGAYRDLGDGSCEMKRLFVPERFQGQGVGRLICEALIDGATQDGFGLMRLDTGFLQREAIAMYRAIGFVDCPPHQVYPAELSASIVFMEKRLS